jgi:hypothetical protein
LSTKPPPLHPTRRSPKVQHHFEDDFNQQNFEMTNRSPGFPQLFSKTRL